MVRQSEPQLNATIPSTLLRLLGHGYLLQAALLDKNGISTSMQETAVVLGLEQRNNSSKWEKHCTIAMLMKSRA
jgi:hypothetical protein